jgi:hypothetical protein
VLDHLHRLALAVGGDDPQFRDDVARLTAVLEQVVSGYVGVVITVVHTGHPIVLTLLHDQESPAVTSVGVRLTSLSAGFDGDSRAAVYSDTPGSLVDLAADLTYALTVRPGDTDGTTGAGTPVELDADLPFTATESSIAGLDELATIHRAVGYLIDRGHHPDTAADTLQGHASAAGLTTHAFAIQLLSPDP